LKPNLTRDKVVMNKHHRLLTDGQGDPFDPLYVVVTADNTRYRKAAARNTRDTIIVKGRSSRR
jgi:hypothetical protein